MASDQSCPHCGFINTAHVVYCRRCDRPLEPPPAKVPTEPDTKTLLVHPNQASRFGAVARAAQPALDQAAAVARPAPQATARPAAKAARVSPPPPSPINEDTVVPAAHAPYARLWGAMLLDGLLLAAIGAGCCVAEMMLFEGHGPSFEGGLFDGLITWLMQYPATFLRGVAVCFWVAWVYTTIAGRYGRTFGRLAFDLFLLRNTGRRLNWPRSGLRAALSLISTAAFGAGFFWTLVDSRRRTLHDILSSSVTVARRVGR